MRQITYVSSLIIDKNKLRHYSDRTMGLNLEASILSQMVEGGFISPDLIKLLESDSNAAARAIEWNELVVNHTEMTKEDLRQCVEWMNIALLADGSVNNHKPSC